MLEDNLSMDIIKEVINIGLGEAAASLSDLMNSKIALKVPDVHIMDTDQVMNYIKQEIQDLGVYIGQNFKGSIQGKTILCYTHECGLDLLKALYKGELTTNSISESGHSTLNEIGNIVMVSYMSAISNFIDATMQFSLPQTTVEVSEKYFETLIDDLKSYDRAIVAKNSLVVEELKLDGYMFVLLSFDDFELIVDNLKRKLK